MASSKISAGSYDLNKWLFGGYEKDVITTFYGPAGSGKTNLCMIAAISQAKKGNKIIFIDTEGGFSIERAKQLAGAEAPIEQVLNNILLLKPTNFEEQRNAFSSLLKELKKGNVGLIIVDSMTMLYRLELGDARQQKTEEKVSEKIKEANNSLAGQLRMLAEIARKQEIPVLVTNQVYADFLSEEDFRAGKERAVKMVGGDLLKYWSKTLIEVLNSEGKRKLYLRKHRSLPEKELVFQITNDGIKKRGFF